MVFTLQRTNVATVLTACGIETEREKELLTYPVLVATVLTACGIETLTYFLGVPPVFLVATVLTACGIETRNILSYRRKFLRLQQCLPLAVLKLDFSDFTKFVFDGCNSAYRLRY